MNKIKGDTIVLSDFDGTITTFDTNIRLFDKYGDKELIREIRNRYYSDKVDIKTLANLQFSSLKMTEDEYLDYILGDVKLQSGFDTFYNSLKESNIPIAIVSGGFVNGIKPFLEVHGYDDIPIHANKLVFNGRDIKVKFYDEEYLENNTDMETFIDCKVEILNEYRKKYERIVFIGDGSTDRYVASEADVLFAKDYLREYCIRNNIEYIPWEDFKDINKWFYKRSLLNI